MIYCIRLATTFRNWPISLQIFGPRNPGDLFSRPPTNNTSANSGQPNFESTSSQPEDICCRIDSSPRSSPQSTSQPTQEFATADRKDPRISQLGSAPLEPASDRPFHSATLDRPLSDWLTQIEPLGSAPLARPTRIGTLGLALADRSPWPSSQAAANSDRPTRIGLHGSASSDWSLTDRLSMDRLPMDRLIHSPTHPLIHSFTRSFICIYSPIYLFID